jgi:5'-3' exonuclease
VTPYLVDASPYIFRAYFAPGPDRPHRAVHGFIEFLVRLIREEQPEGLGVAFDKSLTTSFRNEIYPPYKQQRALPPPELEAQLEACEEAAAAMGAATFVDDRYEADDIVATLSEGEEAAVIVSGDKDLAQLVTDRVTLYDFARRKHYGPAEVLEKFGVTPDQIADLLGIMGDSVDNIPGVKGIGQKGAVALLQAFGSLDAVYQRIDEVETLPVRGAKSLRRKLEESREMAFLSRELATVARDVTLAGASTLAYRGPDTARIDALFERLELGDRLRSRIP